MKYLAIFAALALSACGPTLHHTADTGIGPIYLKGSIGSGDIRQSGIQYNAFLETGRPIIWDGPMVSADAFYAPVAVQMSGGCYTDQATWHPHAASRLGLLPAPDATQFLIDLLPQTFRDEFEGSWHSYDHITVAFYSNNDIRRIWPEGACQ